MSRFTVGLTRDLLTPSGEPSFGAGPLEILAADANIEWSYLPEAVNEITPDIAAQYDALYVNAPLVTAKSVARGDCRLKIVARHGVGYDSVDIKALGARGISVTNTPMAVRRPVAVASLTLVFALAGHLFKKDQLTRTNAWHERTGHMGLGLTTRTLGIVGAGGIGQELMTLARPFGWKMLASDPFVPASAVNQHGASLVDLEQLLGESDFVVLTCVLNEQTRHLINAERLRAMKASAYLINMARGPVIDETALIDALNQRTIAGAGLDVFEQEPVAPDNPLLAMEQVILTPHSLCWTDECFDQIAREGLGCLADYASGKTPGSVVNQAHLPD
ncbi:MAG: 2-hydroxyacid dehydrogenase [Burkholderiaceae bacterium]